MRARRTPAASPPQHAQVGSKAYVIGGANRSVGHLTDVCVYDLEARCWEAVIKTVGAGVKSMPPPMGGHSAVAHGTDIVVFGGKNEETTTVFNDVLVFDTVGRAWRRATVEGEPPAARSGHTACVDGDAMVVFGGATLETTLKDVHILDLSDKDALKWRAVETSGTKPMAREMHAAFILPGRGTRPTEEEASAGTSAGAGAGAAARAEGSTASGSQGLLVVTGGRSAEQAVLDDVCVLDLGNRRWSPKVRSPYKHCAAAAAAVSGTSQFFVLGGFDGAGLSGAVRRLDATSADVKAWSWTTLSVSPSITQRFAVAGAAHGGELFAFGGMSAEADHAELLSVAVVPALAARSGDAEATAATTAGRAAAAGTSSGAGSSATASSPGPPTPGVEVEAVEDDTGKAGATAT